MSYGWLRAVYICTGWEYQSFFENISCRMEGFERHVCIFTGSRVLTCGSVYSFLVPKMYSLTEREVKKKQWHNSRTMMRRKLVSNNHPLYEVINRGHCLGGLDQLTTDRYICIFIVKAQEKTVFSAPRLLYVHKADVDWLLYRQTWLKHGAYPGRLLGWAAHFRAALTSSRREKIEEKQEQKALISMAAIAQPFNNDTEVTATTINSLTACSFLRLSYIWACHWLNYSLKSKKWSMVGFWHQT